MNYCIYCMAHLNDGETNCHRCGKAQNYIAPLHQLAPGTVLCDRYYIGSALGEGGFGITYIGRDLKLDMKVAIKEYFPSGFVNRSNTVSPTVSCSVQGDRKEYFEQGRDRFLREARTLARFSGTDGIVDVRDFFEENNTAYIVMEFLDGETLKENLIKNGVMAADDVISMLMPVFKALKKIHEKDLIHRDISPDNIMLVEDKIKLLDFGSARNVTAAANKSLSVLLKPGYAPEEQYRSKGVQGPWTDIYALCATIYKCITGRTPDDSTDRLFEDSLKMPSEYGIAIDRETEAVIMKGLAVRAADRYQNIDELLSALENRKTIPLAAEVVATEKTEAIEEEKTVGVWGETVAPVTPEIPSEIAEDDETIGIWGKEKTVKGEETVNTEPEKVETPPVETEVEKTESIWSQTEEKTGTADKPEKGKKKIVGVIIAVVMAIFVIAGIVVANIDTVKNLSISAELGDDLSSGKVAIDGIVYQLPCPVYCFTENGWYDTQVPAEGFVVFENENGSFVADCYYDGSGESAMIYHVGGFENTNIDVELPGNIRLGEPLDADVMISEGFSGDTYFYDYEYEYFYDEYVYEDDWIYIRLKIYDNIVYDISIYS